MKARNTHMLPTLNAKLLLIRFNRMLAWALLISPVAQIMMGTGFWRGLKFDLGILLMHAVLSVILFGLPRAESFRHQHIFRRLIGGHRDLLHGRNRFLLDALRIWASVVKLLLIPVMIGGLLSFLMFWPVFVLLVFPLGMACLYFSLLLAASVLRHVRDASIYAYRRWHIPHTAATWLGWGTMGVFVALSYVNLIKGLLL